ncbi:MAG: hypothetical protein ACM3US_07410 [Sphingomonadaceae bacterium]
MAPYTILEIPLANLLVNCENPRYDPQPSQREAIAAIATDEPSKLVALAEDILEKGLNPSELIMVAPAEQPGMYNVQEGNRRIVALKLAACPQLLDSIDLPGKVRTRFKAIVKNANGEVPSTIACALVPEEDAKHWIRLKHTGQNDGVGVVPWNGAARHRFRGNSVALQAIELVDKHKLLDEETRAKLPKIPITNIERVLSTPEARQLIGVEWKDKRLSLVGAEDEVLGRLAIIITQVANMTIRVSDLDTKQQRVEYAERIAAMPLPPEGGQAVAGGKVASATPAAGERRRIGVERKTLIPRSLKLRIPSQRINRIYDELQKLKVDDFVNCCAVMFRVFIELSADHYGQAHGVSLISTQGKEMSLKEKIRAVADDLEKRGVCNKAQLKGIRALAANKDHVLSVDALNAYVHNMYYNPTARDLKADWDTIQPFVEGVWAD